MQGSSQVGDIDAKPSSLLEARELTQIRSLVMAATCVRTACCSRLSRHYAEIMYPSLGQ